jgi:hypothetical protein
MEHVLWNCPAATNAWSVCSRRLQKCSEVHGEFISFVDSMHNELDKDDFQAMTVIT